ncbi:hypothetical protein PG989_005755 [Apiospora arundinis]
MTLSPLLPHGPDLPYARLTTVEAYVATTVPCTLPSITHFIDAINGESYPGEKTFYPSVNYDYM